MIKDHKIIALCTSRIHDDDSHEYVSHLGKKLKEKGYNLFVYATSTALYWSNLSEMGEASVFDLIDYDRVEGVIVLDEKIKSMPIKEKIITDAKRAGIPVLTVGEQYEGCLNISFDYENGFEGIVRHVVEYHNVRDLHFIAGIKGNEFSDSRINVFKKVIAENGIEFSADMLSYGDFWNIPAENATQKLIDENRVPKAVICANDAMAIAAASVLVRNGIRVPQDVIVTGFDGVDDIYFTEPAITSSRCSYGELAERSGDIIVDAVEKKSQPASVKVGSAQILLESCGCCREKPINVAKHLGDLNNRFYRFIQEGIDLTEVTSRVQTCKDFATASREIACEAVYDMTCVLTTRCINSDINPLEAVDGELKIDDMYLVQDTDSAGTFIPRCFSRRDIIPELDTKLATYDPIVFIALHFLNVPLGYACFHFHSDEIENYIKMPQTVSMLNNAIGGLRNMRYQQHLAEQIENMYKLDSLTRLYNRSGFLRAFDHMIENNLKGAPLTVILADLDGLKKINDKYGHGDGDIAIRTIADALKNCCPTDSLCVRFGGDEMLAVVPRMVDEAEIRNKIQTYLGHMNAILDKPYTIGTSLGIYVTEFSDDLNFEDLVKESDKLMYIDKVNRKAQRTD